MAGPKKKRTSMIQTIERRLAEVFELPHDIVLDLPKVTIVGNLQIFLENHAGLLEFSEEKMRVKVSRGQMVVTGKNLVIRSLVGEELSIDGEITGVSFIE